MSSIPASLFVNVIPGVLAPAGNALATIGLLVGRNRRVPIGTVASFADATSVEDFFGAGSNEAILAPYYFGGFTGADASPGAMLVAQYPAAGAPARREPLRSARRRECEEGRLRHPSWRG